MATTSARIGTLQQLMRALFRHSVVLAGDHLGHDDVVSAIEEVTAVYGHKRALCGAASSRQAASSDGALGISGTGRALSEPKSRLFWRVATRLPQKRQTAAHFRGTSESLIG
jgi:hypothetical protein